MATPAQILANRANAQLSTGPKSEAGLARSAANSLTHGFNSRTVILAGEDPDEYDALLFEIEFSFPTGGHFALERAVREMANAEWRLRRARLHIEIALNAKIAELQTQDPAAGPLHLQAKAFDLLLNESNSFKLLLRYETRFENQYRHAQRDWMTCYKLLHPIESLPREILQKAPDWLRSAKSSATPQPQPAPIPRSGLCPCGSGQKYKRCCGRNAPPLLGPSR